MSKEIKKIAWYEFNKKLILMVSDNYRGSPQIKFPYDLLICSKDIIQKYKEELIDSRFKKKIKVKVV